MPTTTTAIQPIERDVLDHFKEGVGLHTIGLRTGLEYSEVQTIVTDLVGGDRAKAAAVVAAYDKKHDGPPARPARPATPAPAPARKPTAARRPAQQEPAAPTVVPVNLSEMPPTTSTVTPANPPHGETGTERAVTLPTIGQLPTARAADLPLDVQDVAGDALATLLTGPTEPLPETSSFETLMDAVTGVPDLAELAGQVAALVDRLHDRYDRERQARAVRGEALALRRELDTRMALLARLAGLTEPQSVPARPAAA